MGGLEKAPKVVFPSRVFGELGFWKVDAKFEASGASMCFGKHFIWNNEISTRKSVIDKIAVPNT
jgi:hypothetical protein